MSLNIKIHYSVWLLCKKWIISRCWLGWYTRYKYNDKIHDIKFNKTRIINNIVFFVCCWKFRCIARTLLRVVELIKQDFDVYDVHLQRDHLKQQLMRAILDVFKRMKGMVKRICKVCGKSSNAAHSLHVIPRLRRPVSVSSTCNCMHLFTFVSIQCTSVPSCVVWQSV